MARSADKTGTTGKSTRRTGSTASVRRTAATPSIAAVPVAETPTVVALAAPLPRKAAPKAAPPSLGGFGDLTAIGKANMDALAQANTVFAQGFKALSTEFFSLTQASLDSTAAATRALLAARTLPEIVALNRDFTKTQYENLVANSARLGELTLKLATDAAAPITARVGVAA